MLELGLRVFYVAGWLMDYVSVEKRRREGTEGDVSPIRLLTADKGRNKSGGPILHEINERGI